MMRLLAVLGVGSVLLVAPTAMAQCTTLFTSRCTNSAQPYTCAAASQCYATEAACLTDSACAQSCNFSGIANLCTSTAPFSCGQSPSCFGSYARCAGDPSCSRSADPTCNTTGVAAGCESATNSAGLPAPFSCKAELSTCYTTYNDCINSPPCAASILTGSSSGGGSGSGGGGSGGGGSGSGGGGPSGSGTNAWGCLAAPGFTPALGAGLLLLLAGRRRTRRV